MKYVAYNYRSTISSNGFENTWRVLAFPVIFDAKRACIKIEETFKVASIISKSNIKDYIAGAKPFSGKSRQIIRTGEECFWIGCVGEVGIDYTDTHNHVE